MSDLLKASIVLALAFLVAVAMYIYFSPYHSCVRANLPAANQGAVAMYCAKAAAGG